MITLAVTLVIFSGWRFGIGWGVAALFAELFILSFITGAQAQAHLLERERD